MSGEFYLIRRDEQGQPIELQQLDPANVEVLREPDGTIRGYDVSNPVGIEPDDDGDV